MKNRVLGMKKSGLGNNGTFKSRRKNKRDLIADAYRGAFLRK